MLFGMQFWKYFPWENWAIFKRFHYHNTEGLRRYAPKPTRKTIKPQRLTIARKSFERRRSGCP